jgi:SAM-dependent methyltransferase
MTIPQGFAYRGSELELFRTAANWKDYWASMIHPYIGTCVLEVGAGLGATTELLCGARGTHWCCLEPDSAMAAKLKFAIAAGRLPPHCEVRQCDLSGLDSCNAFDTILYIDVLEHIEDDKGELRRAIRHLEPGGFLIVLAPAYQWLFTPFDAAVGHQRRYTRTSLQRLTPQGVRLVRSFYLDSVSVLASVANKFFLNAATPSASQIRLWDRVLVRLSKVVDCMSFRSFGKSVVMIWQRNEHAAHITPGDDSR